MHLHVKIHAKVLALTVILCSMWYLLARGNSISTVETSSLHTAAEILELKLLLNVGARHLQ